MFDFSLGLQILQSAKLIFGRNFCINPMQLVKIDLVQMQTSQAVLASRSQVLRSSIFYPLVGTRPIEPTLSSNHKTRWIRIQCFGDDLFTYSGTIGIRDR